jgi:ABC-2 type transport system permease protein
MNLIKKELRELLTLGAIVSVLVMVFVFMGAGSMISEETENLTSLSKVGLVNGDGGEWSEFAISSMQDYYALTYDTEDTSEYVVILGSDLYGDTEQLTNVMKEKGLSTALIIPDDFSDKINNEEQTSIVQYYIFNNEGVFGTTSTDMSQVLVPLISDKISYELVSDMTGSDASTAFLLNPVLISQPQTYINGEIHEGITPMDISSSVMSQTMMVPIVIMMIIIVIGSMVISSMGSEKENKTLETLLTMPVNRSTIVSGKLIAAAIVGLVYGLAYMIGMSFYMGGVTSSIGGVDLREYGIGMGFVDWILLAVIIFLGIFCALGLCMILGAFAKNYKAAQTMVLPISVLAMIPMFVTMFTSWGALPGIAKAILFAIPFSHPMMAMNNLMFNDMGIVLAGMAYLVVFSVIIIFITVKLYKSDILLTGLGSTKAAKAANGFIKGKRT